MLIAVFRSLVARPNTHKFPPERPLTSNADISSTAGPFLSILAFSDSPGQRAGHGIKKHTYSDRSILADLVVVALAQNRLPVQQTVPVLEKLFGENFLGS